MFSLLAEVAAIRDSLIELGPQYEAYVSRYRARNVAQAKPFLDEVIRKYEQIKQQLRDDALDS